MTNGQSRAEHDRRDREVHRLPGKLMPVPFCDADEVRPSETPSAS
jgi:hypothetical protein